MSDERLRELKRRFEASRRPEDEAAWLAARVRACELPRERVELAALLGHPASRVGLGLPERDGAPEVDALHSALKASPVLVTRARLAVGWQLLPLWEASREAVWGQHKMGHGDDWPAHAQAGGYHARHRAALEATEVWLLSRAEADALAARAAGESAEQVGTLFPAFLRNSIQSLFERAYSAAWSIERVALTAGASDPRSTGLVEEMFTWPSALTGQRLGRRSSTTVEPLVLAPLAAELVPWLLNYWDPVRARVAAR